MFGALAANLLRGPSIDDSPAGRRQSPIFFRSPTMPDTSSATPMTSIPQRKSRHSVGLRIIAIYKAIKTVGLLLVATAAFRLDRTQNFERLVHWLEHLSLTDSNSLRWSLVNLLESMGPSKFVAIGIVALAYAAIFATEGIGLWMRKYWAEWFTVIATGSLVPLELYETVRHFTWLKLAVLLVNVIIVVYLVRIALQSRAELAGAG
jgi:uncharacterized membrane protein (DUF2068 family)